jgi:hypothetical protein
MAKKIINPDSEPETVTPGETDFNYGYNVMEALYWDNGDPILEPGVPYEQWEKQQHDTIQGEVFGRASTDIGSKVLEKGSQDRRDGIKVLSDDQWNMFRDFAAEPGKGKRDNGKASSHRRIKRVSHGPKRRRD